MLLATNMNLDIRVRSKFFDNLIVTINLTLVTEAKNILETK